MIVPDHWAEAKERVVIDGSAATYKRFGWSDVSQDAAFENALERVQEAVGRAKQGENVRLIDRKVKYNGADGLPIREQVVERHGETVITRNSYGALCLNTPNVLFADIDITEPTSKLLRGIVFILFFTVACSAYLVTSHWGLFWLLVVIGFMLSDVVARVLIRVVLGGREKGFDRALQRVESFASEHSDWAIRVYRTPNGYRLLVEHELFNPGDEQVYSFMSDVGSDKTYMQMCRNQKCFRARLTPKPWRIDMRHITPRPGIWPIKENRMAERNDWVGDYEYHSKDYAACRYEKTLGSGRPDMDCVRVRELHDDMSRADQALPLA